jgi:phage terminase large subunit-like protein
MLISTTPRPTRLLKALVRTAGVSVTRGTTYDNAANLSAQALEQMKDDICVETNFGGEMCRHVVTQAAERMHAEGRRADPYIRIREVVASRGKVLRAKPISLLYEKGRVLHRPGLDLLESELLNFTRNWDRARDGSPNRVDTLVWCLTRLSGIVMTIPMA